MKLSEKIQCLSYGNILQALKESSVDEFFKQLISKDKLQIVDQTNTVVLDKEIKEDLNGTQSLRRAQSPQREIKKLATFDQIKVSDITSKAKTQIVSVYIIYCLIQKITEHNLKKIESRVRDHFKKPLQINAQLITPISANLTQLLKR